MRVGPKDTGKKSYAMTVQIWSIIIVWLKNTAVQFILKTCKFWLWFLFLKKENQISGTVPESAGEDREVALLWRQVTCLGIGAYVRKVGVGLVLREWFRLDYITYVTLNIFF
jgi:hypothetical protein